jgi:hypothetical protein
LQVVEKVEDLLGPKLRGGPARIVPLELAHPIEIDFLGARQQSFELDKPAEISVPLL